MSRMSRTVSGSKLLTALQEAEVNAQEKEHEQKMKETILHEMGKSYHGTVAFPIDCDNRKRTGSSFSSSPQTYTRMAKSKYSQSALLQGSTNQKACLGPADLSVAEGNAEVLKGQLDFKKSVQTKTFHKKGRKSWSKFVEDCNLRSDSQRKVSDQEVTLKDDPILQLLMNKLRPSIPGAENVNVYKEYRNSSDLSAEPMSGSFSLASLASISTDSIHVVPPEIKQPDREDVLVINDSPDNEPAASSFDKVNHSLKNVHVRGKMKRKLCEIDSAFIATAKRAVNSEDNIIVIGGDNDFDTTQTDCDLANSDATIDFSKTASGKTKMLPPNKTQTFPSKPYTGLISSSASVDVLSKASKSLSSQISSATRIESLPNITASSLGHVKLEQSHTDGALSSIKNSTILDKNQFKFKQNQVSKDCVHVTTDKKQDSIPKEGPTNQNSETGGVDFEDTFDFQDDSLLLAAAAHDLTHFPGPSLHSNCADGVSGDKLNFRFVDMWQRFVVRTVSEDHTKREKYLGLVKSGHSTLSHHCVLRGFWTETQVREGDVVNVLAPFENGQCIVSDTNGFLVLNPDSLISGTAVVSSVFCRRKSVLNEIIKGQEGRNIHMLYGTFLHSLFQIVLKDNMTDKNEIEAAAKNILSSSKFLHEMFSHSISESQVWEEMEKYIPAIISWVSQHTEPNATMGKGKTTDDIVVTDIHDIEENIWSPRLGLKGKIDVTVKVKSRKGRDERILPLEVKTGKASFSAEHKGQVILYSMMFGDRREEVGEGILLYLKHSEMELVKVKPQSQSGLIQLRNSMASILSHIVEETRSEDGNLIFKLGHLPEPINNLRSCAKCPHLNTCCIYQKSVEKISLPSGHAMKQLQSETLAHLDDGDLAYFHHWALCLLMENHMSNKTKLKEIWTLGSEEREKCGDCLCHLVVVSSELGIQETQGFTEGQGCSLTFVRHKSYAGSSLDSVGLNANDSVVVSSEDGLLVALATGFIRNISSTYVEVVVDRARMRKLLIRKMPPSFEMRIPMHWVKKIKPIFKDLNKPQKSAILKVLMAKDFVLIRGFPGSGKTTAIIALVKALNILGMSILLTSYTHSAVDNIALKLKQDGLPFLRLGRQSRIHPHILSHSADILTTKVKSVQELSEFYASYNIVATSCLGMSHSLFARRRFDVCIVDEASQVLQPACLGPLLNCDKFVLVGDGQQLPPLVQSKQARLLGMDESLFNRLENNGATFDLNLQYRMNETIMAVSNLLVYEGKLKCGSPDVAGRCLTLDASKLKDCPPWLLEALSCDIQKAVTFIDTGQTGETRDSKGRRNETEADIVIQLLENLIKAKVPSQDIGVISPYRSQVKWLRQRKSLHPDLVDVEINTVDQYQGRDKSLIIVSFVYSCNNMGGELLKDKRRLNVALTRAQSKLILVGDVMALQTIDHLRLLVSHLEKSNNVSLSTYWYDPKQKQQTKFDFVKLEL